MAGSGMVRRGEVGHGKARSGRARNWQQSVEDWQQSFSECYGEAGLVRSGEAWRGMARANAADRGLATVSLPMQQCIK